MKRLLILFFLTSCTSPNSNIGSDNIKYDFNDDLNFKQFNIAIIEYAKSNQYPNIDQ